MRTAVYVDGFNLYYRALKGTPFRWLDLDLLSRQLVQPRNKITSIRYFTARVKPSAHKPNQHVRQDAYLRAIKSQIPHLTIHEGQYSQHVVDMPLAVAPPRGSRLVKVIKNEEKGSDVNLAVHLLNDAWSEEFDVALVISNDSDLAEAIRLARAKGLPIGVANPDPIRRMNAELYGAASFKRRIEHKHLQAAQLPSPIPGTTITKPQTW